MSEYHIKSSGADYIIPAGYENRAMRRYKKRKGIK